MKAMTQKLYAGFITVAVMVGTSYGQIVPLNFGSTNTLIDEFGQMLEGSAASPGDLVQILNGNQGIFPPALDGTPHVNNPIISTAYVGEGTVASAGPIGKVAGTIKELANRGSPSNTNAIFARIFNAPTVGEASFYTDSSLYDVPVFGDLYGVFFIDAKKTESAIDDNDNDGDGLNNSWEKSYGTDLSDPDSDGDGVTDGNEVLANTNPNDEDEFLQMVELIPHANGNLTVMWDASPGTIYQLEYTTNELAGIDAFAPINPLVTATGTTASTVVTNGTIPEFGTSFRARVP